MENESILKICGKGGRMKKRSSEQQIGFALTEAEAGTPVVERVRNMGLSHATFYNWRKRYEGLEVSEIRRLRALEEENGRLKLLVADLSLDKHMLQDMLSKKVLKPVDKREIVSYICSTYAVRERRSCKLIWIGRSTQGYWSRGKDQRALVLRLKELTAGKPSFWGSIKHTNLLFSSGTINGLRPA